MRKLTALVLSICLLLHSFALPAGAAEEAETYKNMAQLGAALPVTRINLPQETQPVPETTEATLPAEETEFTVPETEPPAPDPGDPRGHHGIPLYFQTDYPSNIYGVGTIANNGCGAVCLAMVATYLTGHEYLPNEIANYFGGAAENNIARLETGSEMLQLPWEKAKNWDVAYKALTEGKIVIALMGPTSLFTQSQHFILLTGLNDEGKIMVNDPYEPNYDKWDIKRGLQEGFNQGDILLGYSGAWIYDPAAMPEEPFIYSEPEKIAGEMRYDLSLSWEDMQLLAKVIWVEARGECNDGQQAVAEVILNRLQSDDFPDTMRGVVFAENQFRSAQFLDEAEPYQLQYQMIARAMFGPYVLPEDVYYFATYAKTSRVWGEIGGHVFCYAEEE